jgi:septal ring factor EnvC (AmiA/AmiB activator)
MRSILDRLQVKCTLCGQNELERANFDKHIEKVCPKIIVSCRAADIKCLWTGQREQLDQHLTTCHFEPMRPAITEMMGEIQQLTDLVDQKIIQITRQQEEIGQLQQQLRFQIAQNSKRQNENQQLRAQMIQLKTQVNTHRRASQQYYEPLKQGDTQTASMSRIQSRE